MLRRPSGGLAYVFARSVATLVPTQKTPAHGVRPGRAHPTSYTAGTLCDIPKIDMRDNISNIYELRELRLCAFGAVGIYCKLCGPRP
jgi:hypothetical protein